MATASVKLFIRYAVDGQTVRRATKVSMVVGPILTVLNHYHTILALDFHTRFFLQMALTFLVPYSVSTYSAAMACVHTHLAGEAGGAEAEAAPVEKVG